MTTKGILLLVGLAASVITGLLGIASVVLGSMSDRRLSARKNELGNRYRESSRAARAGFTILELLLVMAVLLVLTAMTGPAVERAYRAAVARAAWSYHCAQVRYHELDYIELPSSTPSFLGMTTDQAFKRFYPQYRSFADVPAQTVKYWRRDPR